MKHLYPPGSAHAASLISAGRIKDSQSWSPPGPERENAFISAHGLAEFGRWHLGFDADASEDSKGRYAFPFTSDFSTVDYSGLRACLTRAAQAGYHDIEERARHLYEQAGQKLGKPETSGIASDAPHFPPRPLAVPSPLNGERVRVRGETDHWLPHPQNAVPASPSPLNGEKVRMRGETDHFHPLSQPISNTPSASAEHNPPFTIHHSRPMLSTLHALFSRRLTPLCDGRPGLRSTLPVQVQHSSHHPDQSDLSDSSDILDFIASDETLDRFGEVICADGWRLENYRRNPVFQNAHQYGDVLFTLGKALRTEVRDGRLVQRIEFATEANPMARIAFGLYKGKFLNAVSVGFVPIKWEDGQTTGLRDYETTRPETPSAAKAMEGRQDSSRSERDKTQDSPFRRRYLEQELLEVSAVSIPANPNALALGLKAGAIEKTDLHELLELSRALADSLRVDAVTPLLGLARQLRAILRA